MAFNKARFFHSGIDCLNIGLVTPETNFSDYSNINYLCRLLSINTDKVRRGSNFGVMFYFFQLDWATEKAIAQADDALDD